MLIIEFQRGPRPMMSILARYNPDDEGSRTDGMRTKYPTISKIGVPRNRKHTPIGFKVSLLWRPN
jgi:hypothetical protein